MEDEHQSTLKKKIQILFQLGKWPDVVKLSDSYTEKYGRDMEIDMIRFKSERHLGNPVPPPKPPVDPAPAVPVEAEPLLLQPKEQEAVELDAPPTGDLSAVAAPPPVLLEHVERDQPEIDDIDMFGSDPYAENELIITDPFALDEPGMSMAPEGPPVTLSDDSAEDALAVPPITALEMEGPADAPFASPGEENQIDFKNAGTMTIDADPELMEMTAPVTAAIPTSRTWEEERPDEPFRSGAGGVDMVGEADLDRPSAFAMPEAEEKPARSASSFRAKGEEKTAPRKKFFTPKLALLVFLPVLAAVSLWLALTGKLNFSGSEESAARPEAVSETPVVRRPRPRVAPVAVAPQADEQEKAFNEKFQQAEELYKKGDLLKAWAVLLEAKKIKSTEPLRLLEELLAKQIRTAEEQAKQQTQVVQSQWQLETQAFERAEAEDTLSAWQSFLTAFPQGEFASRAEKRIANFEKKAQEIADQQLLLKIQQAQKIRPRNAYLGLSQADITAMLSRNGKPPTQFEAYERGGVKVLLDYASGLMWTLWNKPMAYDKAKWWANRVTAGYGGWRLPTAEEALSLLQADRAHYSGLADFSVWTGDTVSDQARSAWVLRFPEGRFATESYMQACFVWAVRKAGK